jgi:single stranded DNA-binding protein
MASTTTTSGKESPTTKPEQTTPKPRRDLVTKVGNIGSVDDNGAIKLRVTPNGKSVCNFDIAVNTGKGEDKTTTWYKITCWDLLAENVVACLTKGNRVIVWGVPDTEEYTDKEGNVRKQKKINAWSVGVDLNFQQAIIQKIERDSRFANQEEDF